MSARRVVVETAGEAVAQAQRVLQDALARAQRERGVAHLAVCGGSTPGPLYVRLAADLGPVDPQRLHLWWGDERAVPPDHPDSNFRLVQDAWLRHGAIPAAHVHRLRGEARDLDAEAQRAAAELVQVLGAPPRLDLVLLGMGADGHTASLFPGTPAASEHQRWVVAVHQGAPQHARLSLTPAALAQAREVLLLVVGADKAEVLEQAWQGLHDPARLPVQYALRDHPAAVLVADRAAAARVPP